MTASRRRAARVFIVVDLLCLAALVTGGSLGALSWGRALPAFAFIVVSLCGSLAALRPGRRRP